MPPGCSPSPSAPTAGISARTSCGRGRTRCRRASPTGPPNPTSYVFLLAKQPRYFFDQEAVREPDGDRAATAVDSAARTEIVAAADGLAQTTRRSGGQCRQANATRAGRNVRSVWTIPTQPFSGNALGYGSSSQSVSEIVQCMGFLPPLKGGEGPHDGEPQDPYPYRIDGTDARRALELHDESGSRSSRSWPSVEPPQVNRCPTRGNTGREQNA